jgi:hypothetical protein
MSDETTPQGSPTRVPEWERDQPAIALLTSHWLTLVGLALGITTVSTWLFMLPTELPGHTDNPYKGVFLFLILPVLLVGGLTLAAAGILLSRRRIRSRLQAAIVDRRTALHRLVLFLAVTVVANLVVGTQLTYRAVVYMDTPQFCGATCHSMQPEFVGHQDSNHASVSCAECHVASGAEGWVESKMNGTRQLAMTVLNDWPRPIPGTLESRRLVPSRETCERCHWAEKIVATRLVVIPSYASDEMNSASYTVLNMLVGGNAMQGIHHAHFAGGYEVRYAASDSKRQTIPWVERRDLHSGETRTYLAAGTKSEQVAGLRRDTMQCVDCHNRPTHRFRLADAALDRALAFGTVPTGLPFIKQQGLAALQTKYATRAEAVQKIPAAIEAYYGQSHPQVYAQQKADVQKAAQGILAVYDRNVFPDRGVTWGTYPDNIGHFDSPGCFRCHDGSHSTADGKDSITSDCNVCHQLLAMGDASPEILKTLGMWSKIQALEQP